MSLTWLCKSFEELSANELYSILHLRNEVFIVEQQCVFQDTDNKDQDCFHLMGWINNTLAAYARILPAGITFHEISIGRVATSSQFRKTGSGRELMKRAITFIYSVSGKQDIRISAQLYLKQFYESLGFKQAGNVYSEDGIDHIEMLLPALLK